MRKVQTYTKQENYQVNPNEPALLEGWCKKWNASSKWTLPYLKENFGNSIVPISNYVERASEGSKQKHRVKLSDYIDAITNSKNIEGLDKNSYVAGWHFLHNAHSLMEDIDIPVPFQDSLLKEVNNKVINYDDISFFIGHKNVESPLHTDSFFVNVWLACVKGSKTIRICPPKDYELIKNGMDLFDNCIAEQFESNNIPVFEAVIKEGDIFYIPPGWWHQVKNNEFTIAISTNFVNASSFLTFEQQLRSKILKPYVELIKLKRNVVNNKSKTIDHALTCIEYSKFLETEKMFLDFMQEQLRIDRDILNKLSKQVENANN